jgi:rhamnosyltransferase
MGAPNSGPGAPVVSVVVRVKDEADAIARNLRLLAQQTIADATQVVVVDSGSTDGTLGAVRSSEAELVEIPAEDFTYGYSLNVGCERAAAELTVALSAHAYPPDEAWLERMVRAFDDPRVACACGFDLDAAGAPLRGPVVLGTEDFRRHVIWGYSNSAGGFRTELWREHRFREDMPGSEDKEWAWHWMQRDYVTLIDPALSSDHDHSDETLREKYDRKRRDWEGIAMFMDLPRYGPREVLGEWWRERAGWRSPVKARLSPRRLADLAGAYRGRRAVRRTTAA